MKNNCKNRREAIVALVLGELGTKAAKKLREHIDTCQTCRSFYQSLTDEEQIIQSAFEAVAHRGKNIESQLVKRSRNISDKPLTESIVLHFRGKPVALRRILKIAVAAVIIVAVSIFTWFSREKAPTEKMQYASGLSFLSRACAAEQALFSSNKITYILNEIVVYPIPEEKPSSELLDKLNLTPEKRKYLETVNSWLDYNWLPLCSLQADGEFRFNQLKLSKDLDQSYTVTDEAWYDSATGHFARVMKMQDQLIFANSFDGRSIHFSESDAAGSIRLLSEKVREGFNPPQNPAEFLGITAGLQSSIQKDDFQPPVLEVTQETLNDGTSVSTYKLGSADLLGQADTYWLFRVREDDSTVAEMEFILAGSSQVLIRRVLSESVERPAISWDFTQLSSELVKSEESPKVIVNPDIVLPNVSIQHMIEKAGFETYIFALTPSWAEEPEITDVADLVSPGHRMFVITYRGKDGRDLVFCQSNTFNKFFPSVLKQGRLIYTSSNGFKAWAGGPEKWWTEIHLRSAGLTPADDRSGYVFESPEGTYPSLAINGQLTNEELRNLVDSLVSARNVLELSGEELQTIVENLSPGKMEYDPLFDPNNGMPADGLTKEQAMVKIAEEYWKAIINEDWAYVAKLRPVASAEFWKDKYTKNSVIELVEVGQPYKPELPCSGLLVPCIIKLQDGKTIERTLVVSYRSINGYPSCIIPAMWGKARVIE